MDLYRVGRYVLATEIGAGGMATVHLGRLVADGGFARTVAVKRLHEHLARKTEFVSALLDEARLVARIQHPNVVPTLDVVAQDGELLLVMEYVPGETLSRLLRLAAERGERMPARVATGIVAGALHGLHAAHEAKNEAGEPLGIVHRDVSPHNVLVGRDGIPRVLDFGIAKAEGRLGTTRPGQVKGKFAYMAPEQAMKGVLSPRTDLFAAAVVLWEALAGERLFKKENPLELVSELLEREPPAPSTVAPEVPPELDAIVLRALAREPDARYASAEELATALEEEFGVASAKEIAEWVGRVAGERIAARSREVAALERAVATSPSVPPPTAQLGAPPRRGARAPRRDDTQATETDLGDETAAVSGALARLAPAPAPVSGSGSGSTARIDEAAPRGRRVSARVAGAAGAALALVVVSAVVVGRCRARASGDAATNAPVAASAASAEGAEGAEGAAGGAASVSPGASPSEAQAETEAEEQRQLEAQGQGQGPGGAAGIAAPPVVIRSGARARPASHPRTSPRGAGSGACASPYVWDADAGIKRLKRECL